jgi:DNA-binding response OmpR family regulator
VTPPRLLLVEDQPDLARVLQRILRSRRLSVHTSGSCREALQQQDSWDCAILDVDLPDGNGIDLGRELLDSARTLCVVFFSAQSDASVRASAEELGPFVSKTADVDDLVLAVQAEVKRARIVAAAGSGTYAQYRRSEVAAAKRRAKG